MQSFDKKSLVDEAWSCYYCGSLNAEYRTNCGKCNKTKRNEHKII
jgi:hypothetical protein